MNAVLFALVALAGGLGAAVRYVVDGLVRARAGASLPWGTAVINVSGSFALGLVVGLVSRGTLDATWLAIAGTGFLGGLTTFSTASFETVRLLQDRRIPLALATAVLSVVAAGAAAGLGLWAGAAL